MRLRFFKAGFGLRLLTLVSATVFGVGAGSSFAEPLSPHQPEEPDEVARTYVPDAESRLGEVRVLRDGDGLRIRTLLYSNLLKRIVAELEMKSEEGWPEGSRFRAESRQYVSALEAAREEVWARWRTLPNRERGQRTQTLMIDFLVTSEHSVIEIGIPKVSPEPDRRSVQAVEQLESETYAAAFVREEAIRILKDQFPVRAPELIAMLPAASD